MAIAFLQPQPMSHLRLLFYTVLEDGDDIINSHQVLFIGTCNMSRKKKKEKQQQQQQQSLLVEEESRKRGSRCLVFSLAEVTRALNTTRLAELLL